MRKRGICKNRLRFVPKRLRGRGKRKKPKTKKRKNGRRKKRVSKKSTRSKRKRQFIPLLRAERYVKNLPDFGGIFFANDLKKTAVLSFPVAFLIYHEEHWLVAYLSEQSIELFDPLGCVTNSTFIFLQHFLRINLDKKILHASPRIQSATTSNCGQYCICFLYWRLNCGRDLESFLDLFSKDQHANSQTVANFFNSIEK